MLRGGGGNNVECTITAACDDDSNDDNVSLECADSGLGLPTDDRATTAPGTLVAAAAAPGPTRPAPVLSAAAVCSPTTACYAR